LNLNGGILLLYILRFAGEEKVRILSFEVKSFYFMVFAKFIKNVGIELCNPTSVWVKAG